MGRSPEITFGRATADAYDAAAHGDDPYAFLDRCLAESTAALDRQRVESAFTTRLLMNEFDRPLPPDDRPQAVSGEIVVPDDYDTQTQRHAVDPSIGSSHPMV